VWGCLGIGCEQAEEKLRQIQEGENKLLQAENHRLRTIGEEELRDARASRDRAEREIAVLEQKTALLKQSLLEGNGASGRASAELEAPCGSSNSNNTMMLGASFQGMSIDVSQRLRDADEVSNQLRSQIREMEVEMSRMQQQMHVELAAQTTLLEDIRQQSQQLLQQLLHESTSIDHDDHDDHDGMHDISKLYDWARRLLGLLGGELLALSSHGLEGRHEASDDRHEDRQEERRVDGELVVGRVVLYTEHLGIEEGLLGLRRGISRARDHDLVVADRRATLCLEKQPLGERVVAIHDTIRTYQVQRANGFIEHVFDMIRYSHVLDLLGHGSERL